MPLSPPPAATSRRRHSLLHLLLPLAVLAILSLTLPLTYATPLSSKHTKRSVGSWPPSPNARFPYDRDQLRERYLTLRSVSSTNQTSAELSACLRQAGVKYLDEKGTHFADWWDASQSDNLRYHYTPAAIAQPSSAQDVQAAVRCAAAAGGIAVSARSGGHSFAGFGSGGQDGSLIIDMAELKSIKLGTGSNPTAEVEPGARLGDVIKELWTQGKRAMPKGTCPPVGVGGHALCGGFGPTSRRWGMTADNIVGADVVLADGSLVHASASENADLWWGLRGAGVFFGIVTKFTFSTYDVTHPFTFIEYRWSRSIGKPEDLTALVDAVQSFVSDPNLPPELGFHLQFQMPNDNDVPGGVLSVHMRGAFGGAVAQYKPHADRLWNQVARNNVAKPDMVTEREVDYVTLMQEWDDFGKPGHKLDTLAERLVHNNFVARTVLTLGQRGFTRTAILPVMKHLWDSGVRDKMEGERTYGWNMYMEMYGGANARHASPDVLRQTSFPHRDGLWLIQSTVGIAGSGYVPAQGYEWLNRIDDLTRAALKQDNIKLASYSCYTDPHLDEAEWKDLYYGSAIPRLVELKHKLDPENLFRNPQSLGKRADANNNNVVAHKELTQEEMKEMRKWDTHPLPR